VDPAVKLRPETRPECASLCEQIGMRLGAVVLIRNAAGCVCQPAEPAPAAPAAPPAAPTAGGPTRQAGAAAVSGGAYLIALEEEERRQQSHAMHDNPSHTPSYTPPSGTPGSPSYHH